MRIEGELVSQLQAAFYKRDAAGLRFEQAKQAFMAAEDEWRRLGRVVENKFGIVVGKTHWIDIETGEINQLTAVEIPPQPPAPAPPEPPKIGPGSKKIKGRP